MDLTDHVSKEFNHGELVKVAEMMGLAPTSRWGERKLVDSIFAKCKKDGVPELSLRDDDQRLFTDFLFVAELIDEPEDAKKSKSDEDAFDQESKPDCFMFADDKDPACGRCKVYKFCVDARLRNLPDCFGHRFDLETPECQLCIYAPDCKMA